MQFLVQLVARNYVGEEKEGPHRQAIEEGLIHPVFSLSVHAPAELAQAPATSLRQRSLDRSNINFASGSTSVLPGLRAQGPSRD